MRRQSPTSFAVVDLGTASNKVLVTALSQGRLRYRAHAVQPSAGLKKGLVLNVATAAEALRQLIAQVETSNGQTIEKIVMSITGGHIRGVVRQAGMTLHSRSRDITADDVRRVLDLAQNQPWPEDYSLLHVEQQEFALDRQSGVHQSPIGMSASRLEARVFHIGAGAGAMQNRVTAANHAGLAVAELMYAPLAAAEACLRHEEREMGVALVDIGAGCTSLIIYAHQAPQHVGVIPIGGDHYTNDLAISFHTPPADAERIKRAFGVVDAASAGDRTQIEFPGVGEQAQSTLSHRDLCDCLRSRAAEWLRLLENDLDKSGWRHHLGAGLVLTGGGARLGGLLELTQASLRLPVRLGIPALIEGAPDELAAPEFAFLTGATFRSHSFHVRQPAPPSRWARILQKLDALD